MLDIIELNIPLKDFNSKVYTESFLGH